MPSLKKDVGAASTRTIRATQPALTCVDVAPLHDVYLLDDAAPVNMSPAIGTRSAWSVLLLRHVDSLADVRIYLKCML